MSDNPPQEKHAESRPPDSTISWLRAGAILGVAHIRRADWMGCFHASVACRLPDSLL